MYINYVQIDLRKVSCLFVAALQKLWLAWFLIYQNFKIQNTFNGFLKNGNTINAS